MKAACQLAAVFVVRGSAAFGSVLLSLIIARLSGSDALGRFTLFVSILGVFAILARRGHDMLVLRAAARAEYQGADDDHLLMLLGYATHTSVVTALMLCPLGVLFIKSGLLGVPISGAPWFFIVSLPMMAFLAIISGYLKGRGRPWLAPFFELGGVSLIASAFIVGILWIGCTPNLSMALYLFVLAQAILSIIAVLTVRYPMAAWSLSLQKRETRNKFGSGQIPFTVIAFSTFLTQAGSFVLIAPFLSDHAMGLARAVERLALIISFPVLAINPFIAARVVHHLEAGRSNAIWSLIVKASLAGAVIVLPPLLVMTISPETLLRYLGSEFVTAAPYLKVLALAHFALVILGPFAMVPNMGGAERKIMWLSCALVAIAAILYPVFSGIWGIWGFLVAYVFVAVGRGIAVGLISVQVIRQL